MGNNRSSRPPYKPTIATASDLEEVRGQLQTLATVMEEQLERMTTVISAFGTRLAISEHALSGVIQDLYYPDDPDAEGDDDNPDRTAEDLDANGAALAEALGSPEPTDPEDETEED